MVRKWCIMQARNQQATKHKNLAIKLIFQSTIGANQDNNWPNASGTLLGYDDRTQIKQWEKMKTVEFSKKVQNNKQTKQQSTHHRMSQDQICWTRKWLISSGLLSNQPDKTRHNCSQLPYCYKKALTGYWQYCFMKFIWLFETVSYVLLSVPN